MSSHRGVRSATVLAFCAVSLTAGAAFAQAWKPEKPVEIIVPTGAAGINDSNSRLIQKTLTEQKLVPTPVLVLNKAGGNQSLAAVYMSQHANDPHYLFYATATLFTNQLAGVTPIHYRDLTPLALLLVDYTVITVKADSPMKNMRDLVERLKSDPDAVSFGLVARGGPNHLAVSQAMRSAGLDPKKLKLVVFKTNAESITAVIGGHVQAMVSSVSAALPQVQAGNARMLGVAAPQRVGGSLANLPTMREQGIEATGISNWRTIFGAKGLTQAQTAFWQDALAKVVASPEWKAQLAHNNLESKFMRGPELAKWLEGEYSATRAVMADIGLIK
ncbi:MAG TPA: tripartite tricarboxylate transporter substrate binding protein [Burkholderiales bacterium]|nr:tripartite tricarboxylate transporter substrate binding protein [Burkholderiales bacterium]